MLDYLRIMLDAQKAKMDERGASAVEYGLLIAGIAALIVAIVFVFGGALSDVFQDTCNSVAGTANLLIRQLSLTSVAAILRVAATAGFPPNSRRSTSCSTTCSSPCPGLSRVVAPTRTSVAPRPSSTASSSPASRP